MNGLERFRVDENPPTGLVAGEKIVAPGDWEVARSNQPPKGVTILAANLRAGEVLAFDQTVRNTGYAFIASDGDRARVQRAGTLKTKAGEQRGWDVTLADATRMALDIERLVEQAAEGRLELTVAHEAPPSGGGKLSRPESSALAALGVRLAVARLSLSVVMLSNQSAKYRLTGDRGAKKIDIKRALEQLDWFDGCDQLRNEHERDAAALGLLHLTKGD